MFRASLFIRSKSLVNLLIGYPFLSHLSYIRTCVEEMRKRDSVVLHKLELVFYFRCGHALKFGYVGDVISYSRAVYVAFKGNISFSPRLVPIMNFGNVV